MAGTGFSAPASASAEQVTAPAVAAAVTAPQRVAQDVQVRALLADRALEVARASRTSVRARAVAARKAPVVARAQAKRRLLRLPAVAAYARAQVGKSYRDGATGPRSYDCSGLVMQAYKRIGISLPHSSTAQRARSVAIPRSRARVGDLVVGPRHVGIYMGGGRMVDAGNSRVGVVHRRMYAGLSVRRLKGL